MGQAKTIATLRVTMIKTFRFQCTTTPERTLVLVEFWISITTDMRARAGPDYLDLTVVWKHRTVTKTNQEPAQPT